MPSRECLTAEHGRVHGYAAARLAQARSCRTVRSLILPIPTATHLDPKPFPSPPTSFAVVDVLYGRKHSPVPKQVLSSRFSVLSRLKTGSGLLRTENRELRTHQK